MNASPIFKGLVLVLFVGLIGAFVGYRAGWFAQSEEPVLHLDTIQIPPTVEPTKTEPEHVISSSKSATIVTPESPDWEAPELASSDSPAAPKPEPTTLKPVELKEQFPRLISSTKSMQPFSSRDFYTAQETTRQEIPSWKNLQEEVIPPTQPVPQNGPGRIQSNDFRANDFRPNDHQPMNANIRPEAMPSSKSGPVFPRRAFLAPKPDSAPKNPNDPLSYPLDTTRQH